MTLFENRSEIDDMHTLALNQMFRTFHRSLFLNQSRRYFIPLLLLLLLGLLVTACGAPRSLPDGPTPIPTLIPATEPAKTIELVTPTSFIVQSYPARLPSAKLGQATYQTHCANCHGIDGKGVMPGARNFNDLDYMRGEYPAYFYATTTEGRKDMPSFKDVLTSDERWDVVFYVWAFSTDPQSLAAGQNIYKTSCAACHGEDGVGAVLGAADFNDLRSVGNRSPRDFYLTVTQGKGSMPAWQGRLSQDERWDVIDYLYTFTYEPLASVAITIPLPTATAEQLVCNDEYLSQENPFSWTSPEAISAGEEIYDRACAACHGTDGAGAIPNVPDLTSPEVQRALRTESGTSLCIVAEGRGIMPGWKETLSIEQMWQVLTFLANLKP